MRKPKAQRLNWLCLISSLLPIGAVALFIYSFGQRVPVYDQWERSIFLAMDAENGSLRFVDLIGQHNGHRLFFSNLITVAFAHFTTWNPRQEVIMNLILGVINFGLLALLIHQQRRRLFYIALLPISLLHFSLFQDFNWSVSFQSQWHLVVMFFLMGLISITQFKPGKLPFFSAMLFAICATFSSGNGLLSWIILGVMVWWQGYRGWQYFAIWIGAACITIAIYFSHLGGVTGDIETSQKTLALDAPLVVIRFVIAFVGSPFGYREIVPASLLGMVGISAFATNLYYLHQTRTTKKLAIWLAIAANGLGTGVLIALTRSDGSFHMIWRALLPRFSGMASQFWIATVVLIMLASWHLIHLHRRTFGQRLLLRGNVLVGLLLLIFYCHANMWIVRQNAVVYGNGLVIEQAITPQDQCVLDFPLYRDMSCLREHPINIRSDPDLVYAVAEYELSVFADAEAVNVLPATYQHGEPIIINSPSRWLNAYIRDWMLAGISENALFHIAPASDPYEQLPKPLDGVIDALTPVSKLRVERFTEDAAHVWYITTPERADQDDHFFAMMHARGYRIMAQEITDPRYADAKFSLYLCIHDLLAQRNQLIGLPGVR